MTRFLLLSFAIFLACAANSHSKLQFCSRSDPNLNKCLQVAIQSALVTLQRGIKEYGVPSIEVFSVPAYTVKSDPPIHFDQSETDIRISGHLESEIKDVDAKIEDSDFSLTLTVLTKKLTYLSNYDYKDAIIDGVDMSGKGKKDVIGDNFQFTVTFTGVVDQKGGERYLQITQASIVDVMLDMVHFSYGSTEDRSGELLTNYLTKNMKSILAKESKKYMVVYEEAYKTGANAVFSKIPYDVLFPK
ncbi:hypothetical protein PPYR_02784 [Photinus pyralis]|uniref:Uncharacterized protein n=1 Tax=Photinus pyralis TaxID=7054 RepID=A0A1Y1LTP6_PHOPY|nr:uncharacterized protein LOC116161969 [Photinus pyralis]XP_031357638.1 uncharacterized protein LOC116181412 [Photinus pyralis]KAB0790984.1 hypothetical protein PPYR_02784 [Photinus pyralis]